MRDSVLYNDNSFHFSMNKKLFYFFIFILLGIIFILLGTSFSNIIKHNISSKIVICGDGSFTGTCSLTKPYFCNSEGVLVSDADICGCSENFNLKDGSCVSVYEVSPKEITLKYSLEGKENFIDYVMYEDFNNYFYSLKQSISYSEKQDSSRADFKLNKIDDDLQRDFLMPLVIYIQNLGLSKDDQVRVAISLVQNIPFGESNKTFIFGGQKIPYSRYPYQVLYDYEGVCGEKTELLSFLLRELGYGISFFYYSEENHEALGIKCPIEKSFSSIGYCFVETTAPSIISDNGIIYSNIGKLSSVPELYFISEGLTFGENGFYEIHDAKKLKRIRKAVSNRGWLGPLMKKTFDKLKNKYSLVEEYFSG